MRVTGSGSRDERAFTIVEVLIAALVITAVFAGAVHFMVGAGKSQQKTLVRQRMAAAADGIVQKVRADRTWLAATPSCKTSTCDLSARFQPAATNARGPQFAARVEVSPVDSDGDGRGGDDEDGVRPDFYRIQVVVTLPPGEAAEWGEQRPFETVSTVDATALGRATGTLVVQVGETTNQVDDRMPISSVRSGGDRVDMRGQVEPCSSPFPISWDEWVSRRPILPLGCNDAFNDAASKDAFMGQVELRPAIGVAFSIERDTSDGGPSVVRQHTDADGGTAGPDGTYTFSGIPSGTYRVVVNPPANREAWDAKMVPSQGRTSVQANQKASALVMVRPKQGTGSYGVRFTRDVYIYSLGTESDSVVGTYTQSGVTVEVTTHYVYLVAQDPRRELWHGPAWNGLISLEPKPFDRFRAAGTGVGAAAQNTLLVPWTGENLATVPSSHPNKDGWWHFQNLPTGLHSSPKQQERPIPEPASSADVWDRFDANDPMTGRTGSRTQACDTSLTPGGTCGDFAWLSHLDGSLGRPNGSITYHSPYGECYLESSVAAYPIPRRLQLGETHATRCSRDLVYRNLQTGVVTRIPNFLPDKNGNGGGRMVLQSWQTARCVANCGTSSTTGTGSVGSPEPSTSGPGATVAGRSSRKPRPPKNAPSISVTTTVPKAGGGTTTSTKTIGAAPAVSMPATSP